MSWSRRRLLQVGGALAGVTAAGGMVQRAHAVPPQSTQTREASEPVAAAGGREGRSKRVALVNLHTGEKIDLEFMQRGAYVPEAMMAIQALLRDYRTGEQHAIETSLMDYLFDVALRVGADPEFSVISGYRSAQTNERLRERSNGVAQHSLHMEGRAVDVRLRGIDCLELAGRARDMARGGVGYYRKTDFVHLDTGPVRTWNG